MLILKVRPLPVQILKIQIDSLPYQNLFLTTIRGSVAQSVRAVES